MNQLLRRKQDVGESIAAFRMVKLSPRRVPVANTSNEAPGDALTFDAAGQLARS